MFFDLWMTWISMFCPRPKPEPVKLTVIQGGRGVPHRHSA
jgi:hypothetical protein